MTIGKITSHNSVKYIPQSEQTRERERGIGSNLIMNNSRLKKRKKKNFTKQ